MKLKFDSLLEVEDFVIQLGWVKAAQSQFATGTPMVRETPSPGLVSLFRDQGLTVRSTALTVHTNSPSEVDWRGPVSIDMGDFAKLKTVRQVVSAIKAAKADIKADTVFETCQLLVSKDKCPVLSLLPAEDLEARVRGACESLGID